MKFRQLFPVVSRTELNGDFNVVLDGFSDAGANVHDLVEPHGAPASHHLDTNIILKKVDSTTIQSERRRRQIDRCN